MLSHILKRSMSKGLATRTFEQCDDSKPFYSVLEYQTHIASLVALYPDEVKKKTSMQGKPLYKVLWNSALSSRVGWLFNNTRLRRLIPFEYVPLLPSGTSANESLHREINSWFRNNTSMHQATLMLKLRINHVAKLMTHNSVLYLPTLRQMRQGTVLHCTAVQSQWSATAWASWCGAVQSVLCAPKADLPLARLRKEHASTAKQWLLKRPVAHKRPAACYKKPSNVKRHAFNVRRLPSKR